jgi:hypothetical protein
MLLRRRTGGVYAAAEKRGSLPGGDCSTQPGAVPNCRVAGGKGLPGWRREPSGLVDRCRGKRFRVAQRRHGLPVVPRHPSLRVAGQQVLVTKQPLEVRCREWGLAGTAHSENSDFVVHDSVMRRSSCRGDCGTRRQKQKTPACAPLPSRRPIPESPQRSPRGRCPAGRSDARMGRKMDGRKMHRSFGRRRKFGPCDRPPSFCRFAGLSDQIERKRTGVFGMIGAETNPPIRNVDAPQIPSRRGGTGVKHRTPDMGVNLWGASPLYENGN